MDKLIDKIVHFCLDSKLVLFLIFIALILKLLSIY
jgi:hypothetical protein